MSDLQFISRKAAEALDGQPDLPIISITDPGKRLADLKGYAPNLILRLVFDDACEVALGLPPCLDPVNAPLSGVPSWVWSGVTWFSVGQALAIRDFVDNLPRGTAVRVHCERGESRSAAVVRWLAAYLRRPEPPGISIPNGRVLRLLSEVAHR